MKFNNIDKIFYLTALSVSLIACGGGGGGGTGNASGTTSKVGVVTGFGSVFINGIEYETDGASIVIDGQSVTEDHLRVGMIVEVEGTDDGQRGHATRIHNDDEIEGIVISNSVDATTQTGTMNVMGQTLHINDMTMFESHVSGITAISMVQSGNIVEVNGYTDGNGDIFATRVEVKAVDLATYLVSHAEGIEVKGNIAALDSVQHTFTLGDMVVDYADAIIDVPGGLMENQYVEVKSTAGIDTSTGHLIASKVELENDGHAGHHGDEGDEVEIRGTITSNYADNRFSINGTVVIVDQSTEFERISTSDLVMGAYVKVEGVYDSDGNLLADEIEREDEANDEIAGMITQIESTDTNTGVITLQDGTMISVTSETMMQDDNGLSPELRFNLSHLRTGDFIEVHGYYDADMNFVAVKLKRDDSPSVSGTI